MKKCFFCGNPIPDGQGVTGDDKIRGRKLYFCSKECRASQKDRKWHYCRFPRHRLAFREMAQEHTFEDFMKEFRQQVKV